MSVGEPSLRDKLVRNYKEAKLETLERAPLYETRYARVIGPAMDGVLARDLGASYDELLPGKAGCPYHSHYGEEEMFVILEGEGTLRVAGKRIPIRAGDVIDIPPGPEYPHQIINTSDAPLKFLSISTQKSPEVCEYPDSGKYGVFAQPKAGLLDGRRLHRPDSNLDYWDGEP
jgi:uncharacterized cupin superfamily protein